MPSCWAGNFRALSSPSTDWKRWMPHLEMCHALLDFQCWEKRADPQGNGADLRSHPASLQCHCGHRTAVLIIRGGAPAHQHQQIGQFPPREIGFQNISLAGAGFRISPWLGLVLLGFSWRHRQTPAVSRCWEDLAKKEGWLQPLSHRTSLLRVLCRHSGPPKFLLIHPDESLGLWSSWKEQLSKSFLHLLWFLISWWHSQAGDGVGACPGVYPVLPSEK